MTKEQILQDIDFAEDILLNKNINDYIKPFMDRNMIVDIDKPYITITHSVFFIVYDTLNKKLTFKPMPTSEHMINIVSSISWGKPQLIDYINHIDEDVINQLITE